MKKKYQSNERKSNHKFEIVRGQELLVQVPLPMAEVWSEMQAQVEELTGQAAEMVPCGANTILIICFSAAWGQSIRGEPAP